ncbi:MAG: hypothetical protein JO364_16055 [Pseudonocardiales bacterium]|nr:hypothetical protein [Pseudonocardiales bacterium]MBV9031781.1 hypothetical protein [Pseudonocardiales bacterium]
MTRRATALDRARVTLDRCLVRAVVRALHRAREVGPVAVRDLFRLARDLAQELEFGRDLAQELELARAGNARELAGTLELVRTLELALELALDRELDPGGATAPEPTRAAAPDLDRELALERELELAFERAPAFVRTTALVRILTRVRALVRALVRARDFVATYEDERTLGRGARVVLGPVMGLLMALAVQVLPVSRQLRHLEEFCAELLELRWWQWPGHTLCILICATRLRRALTEARSAPDGAQARRAKR